MPQISAGLLMYRIRDRLLEVLLVHPGGPFFKNKDEGAWSIPKGEAARGENLLETAQREFTEELGLTPQGPYLPLTPIRQKGGKTVHAWALKTDIKSVHFVSNLFAMEWPPKSGHFMEFPEVDRAEFFEMRTAKLKINVAQIALLEELESLVGSVPLQHGE